MKITICGSMSFAKEMLDAKAQLESQGHKCLVPIGADEYVAGIRQETIGSEGAARKSEIDSIRNHYQKIQSSDAVLVLNYDRRNIVNYIGGNSLIEMAFAHVLNKRIFLLNPIPNISYYDEEIIAMKPMVLHGDLSKIPKDMEGSIG